MKRRGFLGVLLGAPAMAAAAVQAVKQAPAAPPEPTIVLNPPDHDPVMVSCWGTVKVDGVERRIPFYADDPK